MRAPQRKVMQANLQGSSKGRRKRSPCRPGQIISSSRLGESSGAKKKLSTGRQLKKSVTNAANRSMKVIKHTLDKQDMAECVVVQNKLQDLQCARRDFVMTVANVSGNAVSFAEDINKSVTLPGSPLSYKPGPLPSKSPQRYIYKIPDVNDPFFQVDMERHQETFRNARDFLKRKKSAQARRKHQKKIDKKYAREVSHDSRYNNRCKQNLSKSNRSSERSKDGSIFPCHSRIKASMPPMHQRHTPSPYYNCRSVDVEELERFFGTTKNPIVASSYREKRKPAQDTLRSDLRSLKDPWSKKCSPQRDLMHFTP